MKLFPLRRRNAGSAPSKRQPDEAFDLVIVLPNLCRGGAQRVATALAGAWVERGLRIAVITLHSREDAQILDPRVVRLKLHEDGVLRRSKSRKMGTGLWRAFAAVGPMIVLTRLGLSKRYRKRVLKIRALLQRTPSPVILAFLGATNIMTVLAATGLRRRVVISERNDPARQALDPPWQRLRPLCYRHARAVTANSQGALDTMEIFVPSRKLHLVPNPLVIPTPIDLAPRPGRRLVSVSRLVPQKGLDMLLSAFALITDALPDWHLDLVGDGPERTALEEFARTLGIADRVIFHGHQHDPFPFFRTADVFALTSHFEGMPNAMLEAMACSVPPIVVDSSPGPREYVEHGINGLVVAGRDPAAFAAAIHTMARDEPFRRRAGRRAMERVQDLDLATTLDVWNEILCLPPMTANTRSSGRPEKRATGCAKVDRMTPQTAEPNAMSGR